VFVTVTVKAEVVAPSTTDADVGEMTTVGVAIAGLAV
jgi:hypothetical protein